MYTVAASAQPLIFSMFNQPVDSLHFVSDSLLFLCMLFGLNVICSSFLWAKMKVLTQATKTIALLPGG